LVGVGGGERLGYDVPADEPCEQDEGATPRVRGDLDERGADAPQAADGAVAARILGGHRAGGHPDPEHDRGHREGRGVAEQRDGGGQRGDEQAAGGEADELGGLAGDLPDGEPSLVQLTGKDLGVERELGRGVR
jgi:hypothetical protein